MQEDKKTSMTTTVKTESYGTKTFCLIKDSVDAMTMLIKMLFREREKLDMDNPVAFYHSMMVGEGERHFRVEIREIASRDSG